MRSLKFTSLALLLTQLIVWAASTNCAPGLSGCQACVNSTHCQTCQIGYGLDYSVVGQVTCLSCSPANCSNCSTDFSVCNQCFQGYGTELGGDCIPCTTDCLTCMLMHYHYCTSCHPGYFLVVDSCYPCPPNCTHCFLNTSLDLLECTDCYTGYQLNNSIPVTCRQLCGDSFTTVYPCDNQLNQPYDGCNNSCQVQPDFNCSVVANRTTCSFNGTLQMTFLYIKRDSTTNHFVMEVKVFPPLYAFKITSPQVLNSIFIVSNPNLKMTSTTYNPLTETLKFEGDLINTLNEGNLIEITFMPSLTSIAIYSSSIQASISVTVNKTIYFLSELTLEAMKIIPFICYGLIGLGWISLVLGAIMRRLAGLEAFVVLQFSCQTLLWIRSDFLPNFQQIAILRFTAGYNFHILSEELGQSVSAPYLSQFSISSAFFANNFNLPLIIMGLLLLVVLVTTIRLKKYLSQVQSTLQSRQNNKTRENKMFDQEGDGERGIVEITEEMHADTLLKQNQRAYTLLMYSAVAFVIYFTFCSAVFFSFGTLTNIPSLVFFVLTLCCMAFTFVQFGRDPTSFNQFRFSFRTTPIAMNHYFIHLAAYVISVLLLVVLLGYPWAGLPVLLLMLAFTIIYRPYKELAENLRSAFNYATLSFFLGFLVYLQIAPWTNTTTILLMVNVAMLLPLVVLISFVSSTYYFYYYNYVLPREQQAKDKQLQRKRRKILKQLSMISACTKMQEIPMETTFRQLVPPSNNLKNVSDALRDQFLLRERMRQEAEKGKEKERVPLEMAAMRQASNNRMYAQYKNKIKNETIKQKEVKQKDNGFIGELKFIETQGKEQVSNFNGPIAQPEQQKETELQIAKSLLINENKYINLRRAIEIVEEDLNKPIDQKLIDAFNNIIM